jgi:uncharacterized protein YndB with AHSA1/START domain
MNDTEVVFEPGRQDIVVTRVFDVPREVVFQAVTDPALIPRWWGARRFVTEVDHMDVRRGGQWRFVTRNAETGSEYAFRGVYHDVTAPERIVGTFEFEQGGPGHLQLTVETFEDLGGRTRYVSVALFRSVEDRDQWIPTDLDKGVRESMDLLDELVRQAQAAPAAPPGGGAAFDVVVKRVLDAPAELVWQAWTEPGLVRRWWGPHGFTSPLARMDVRPGGTSLVCMRSPDGHDLYNTWTYGTVRPAERLEFVLRFSDETGAPHDPASLGLPPGIPAEVPHVVTFRAVDERTTELTVTEHGYTVEATRDGSRVGLEQCLEKMAAALA